MGSWLQTEEVRRKPGSWVTAPPRGAGLEDAAAQHCHQVAAGSITSTENAKVKFSLFSGQVLSWLTLRDCSAFSFLVVRSCLMAVLGTRALGSQRRMSLHFERLDSYWACGNVQGRSLQNAAHCVITLIYSEWPATQVGGSVAEWSKALDLGSSHFDGVGSNPTAATSLIFFLHFCMLFGCVRSSSILLKLILIKHKEKKKETNETGLFL